LLETIKSPAELRGLSAAQLEALATEIREFLIEHISETGGHLSPNLGVVELTLALHRVFDSPRDAIIWDTGHQAYVHKLVTGRAAGFKTLRQAGGMSGYPSRAESEHDWIENSHASTSLSYALGIAQARLRKGEPGHVIAVIGDGALTGGMAYEALNQIAHLQPANLIVVINDNGRSYAPTVGGLARHLANLAVDPRYERLKDQISRRLKDLPAVGTAADAAAYRLKESLKQLVQPTTVFDSLGLKYAGPVDGHDLGSLELVLARAREIREPVVVHVVTEKGRGYGPAIGDEIDKLHGVSAFDPETGRPRNSELSYTDVFGEALMSAAMRHPEVVAMTAAMASSTGLLDFSREFPDRFYDVGICEQHAVTFAAGLATQGIVPIVAIYSTFLQRGFDQVVHDVAIQELPVVFAMDRGGIVGDDGRTHQGLFDIAYLRPLPGIVLMAPKDEAELRQMVWTAVRYAASGGGPIAFRYPRGTGTGVTLDAPLAELPIGISETLREGADVAILAYGTIAGPALAAAEALAADGIEATVVNARFAKPLDADRYLTLAARVGRVLTVEEHVVAGGFGSAVGELFVERGAKVELEILGVPDEWVDHGAQKIWRKHFGLDAEGIAGAVRRRWPQLARNVAERESAG
jgi:1-deoxy-D-xylulose-5-phosphate synthase